MPRWLKEAGWRVGGRPHGLPGESPTHRTRTARRRRSANPHRPAADAHAAAGDARRNGGWRRCDAAPACSPGCRARWRRPRRFARSPAAGSCRPSAGRCAADLVADLDHDATACGDARTGGRPGRPAARRPGTSACGRVRSASAMPSSCQLAPAAIGTSAPHPPSRSSTLPITATTGSLKKARASAASRPDARSRRGLPMPPAASTTGRRAPLRILPATSLRRRPRGRPPPAPASRAPGRRSCAPWRHASSTKSRAVHLAPNGQP
jgi:hypothetical protein